MAEARIGIIAEFLGKKAFKDADTATSKLDRGVKRLGASLLAAFSVQKITAFGKAAAKAFIEDEKAAIRLAQSVKNLGLAFETPRIEKFISEMSLASGIADDILRPSMQKLLQTVGSVSKAQELLTQALDISRGSGVAYETVVNDLSMAFTGQTRGLRKYYLGLSQAELKAMSFAEIQEKLAKNFTGANLTYLETYAGKMDILSTASGEAAEIIGEGLVNSLLILSGDTTVDELALSMQDLATNTSNAIEGLARFTNGVLEPFKAIATVLERFILATDPFVDLIVEGDPSGFMTKPKPRANRLFGGGQNSLSIGAEARQKRADAQKLKIQKDLTALQKKNLDAQKKQNALTKASKVLDLDRISVTAALRGQISETDRLSLQLQLALLDKNESQALKLSAELTEATKRQNDLKAALLSTPEAPNPYRNWIPPKNPFGIPYGEMVPNFNVPDYVKQGAGITGRPAGDYLGLSAIGAGATADTILNVVVNVDGDPVANAITSAQVNQSLSGTFSDVSRYNGRGAPSIK